MIKTTMFQVEKVQVPPEFDSDPSRWLGIQAKKHQIRWLLAFADDGVIWGFEKGNQIQFARDLSAPTFRELTLYEARFFGRAGELLIWKTNLGWEARILADDLEMGETREYFDQQYILWGEEKKRVDGFILLQEGSRGIQHAPPIPPESSPADLQISLTYRHYLEYDADGQIYIAFSRLVSLNPRIKEEKQ